MCCRWEPLRRSGCRGQRHDACALCTLHGPSSQARAVLGGWIVGVRSRMTKPGPCASPRALDVPALMF